MCRICGFLFCPPGCPRYKGEWAGSGPLMGECAVCEGALHQGDAVFARGELLICAECVSGLWMDQLLDLCELEDRAELLCAHLGFDRRRL